MTGNRKRLQVTTGKLVLSGTGGTCWQEAAGSGWQVGAKWRETGDR